MNIHFISQAGYQQKTNSMSDASDANASRHVTALVSFLYASDYAITRLKTLK